jgi:hypothetical protein
MKVAMGMCERHSWAEALKDTRFEIETQEWYEYSEEKYSRLCVWFGPEEGPDGFYTEPYCKECLEEAIQEIKDAN